MKKRFLTVLMIACFIFSTATAVYATDHDDPYGPGTTNPSTLVTP